MKSELATLIQLFNMPALMAPTGKEWCYPYADGGTALILNQQHMYRQKRRRKIIINNKMNAKGMYK